MANDGQGAPRVLVTGAGCGLGRHLAVDFARRGCRIAIADLNAAGVEESLGLCRKLGAEGISVVGDLTQAGAPDAAVSAGHQHRTPHCHLSLRPPEGTVATCGR